MANLPSGLPKQIDDDEYLARFLTSSRWFSTTAVKVGAFLPYKGETSVTRNDPKPASELWAIAESQNLNNVYGAAILKARDVRGSGVDVFSAEPPSRHAAIRNWPTHNDPTTQKSQQLGIAQKLAEAAGKALLKS